LMLLSHEKFILVHKGRDFSSKECSRRCAAP
jgi:hypothetical protein